MRRDLPPRHEDVRVPARSEKSASIVDRFAVIREAPAITLIGATERSGSALLLLSSILHDDSRFSGKINIVNRGAESVLGLEAVSTVEDIEGELGIGWLLIGAENAVKLLRTTDRAFAAVVVFSGGFSEVGNHAGQQELEDWARSTQTPVFGPQSVGFGYFPERRNFLDIMWKHPITPGPVALLAQSGGILTAMAGAMTSSGPGVRCAFSLGNEAVEDVTSVTDALLDDAAVQVIVIYAEQFKSIARFSEVAARAAAVGKPLVLLMGGVSEVGQALAASHTGALATPHQLVQGIAEQYGVVLVESIDDMLDAANALTRHGFRRFGRGRVGYFSNTQGLNIILADYASRRGMTFVQPSPETLSLLPGGDHGNGNPYDGGAGMLAQPEEFTKRVAPFVEDPNFDILCHQIHQQASDAYVNHQRRYAAFNEAARAAGKPVVVGFAFDEHPRLDAQDDHVSLASGLRQTVAKVKALAEWSAAIPPFTTPRVHQQHSGSGVRVASDEEARLLLAQVPVVWPTERVIESDAPLPDALARLGYPVVLKARISAAHRAAAGGVILGIGDEASATAGIEYLRQRFGCDVVACAQIPHDEERFLGLSYSEEGLPILLAGTGGADLGENIHLRVLPLSQEQTEAALAASGYPQLPSGTAHALVVSLQDVLESTGTVAIDLNPLIIAADGQVTVLDAKVHVSAQQTGV